MAAVFAVAQMTAEVAILNKIGVALAADSTVTITTANGDKTYNTTNKLFALSKFHPVGIMIFNGTEFNGIPFELIIKEFRDTLGKGSKPTLQQYANAFIRHLKTKAHVTKEDQSANFESVTRDFCLAIRKNFREGCRDAGVPIPEPRLTGEASKFFTKILDELELNVATAGVNPAFKGVTEAQLQRQYRGAAKKLVDRLFARIEPSIADRAAKQLGVSNPVLIKKLREELEETAKAYIQQMHGLRRIEAQSVLRSIRVLDKAEMAILAENIVSLTALKQKFSLETETVGGPKAQRQGRSASIARCVWSLTSGLTNYFKYPTTIRVVSSTSVRSIFSDSVSAWFSTVLCATDSIALTQMKVATSRSSLRISLRRLSR